MPGGSDWAVADSKARESVASLKTSAYGDRLRPATQLLGDGELALGNEARAFECGEDVLLADKEGVVMLERLEAGHVELALRHDGVVLCAAPGNRRRAS